MTDGQRQTDRRTDGIAMANTALSIACNAATLEKHSQKNENTLQPRIFICLLFYDSV